MSEAIFSDNSIVCIKRQTKEWTLAKVIYAGLMAFNLLSFLWLLVIGSDIEMPPIIWIARIATAPLAICLGKLWKDRGFQILSVYTFFFFFRVFIPNQDEIFRADISESVLSALWLFAGCYGFGNVFNAKQTKQIFSVFLVVWLLGIVICSCLGIYSAWFDIDIKFSGNRYIGLDAVDRLQIIYYATTTGAILNLAFIMQFICFVSTPKKKNKVVFTMFAVSILVAISLTDSRTAYIGVSSGIAIIFFVFTYRYVKKVKINRQKLLKIHPVLICTIGMIIVFIIMLYIIMTITPLFNHIKMTGLIPSAFAETSPNEKSAIVHRGFSGERVFTGRIELWKEIISYIIHNPLVMLLGFSKNTPLQQINQHYAHCHNIYFQVWLESGILGFTIFFSFIIYTIKKILALVREGNVFSWIICLPAIIIYMLIVDFAECFTWLRSSQCPMSAFLFLCCGILFNSVDDGHIRSAT